MLQKLLDAIVVAGWKSHHDLDSGSENTALWRQWLGIWVAGLCGRAAGPGDQSRVCLPHPEIFDAVEPGHHLLVNDGRVRLEILAVDKDKIDTKVIFGGTISARKGVNLPATSSGR